jgi:hypothetical protein
MADPFRVPEPPAASVAALRESLAALADRGQFSARSLRETPPADLSASVPHEVFNLGLDAAADGEVERAEPGGWRYLLEADKGVVATAETRAEGGEHTFSNVNTGPFVKGTVDALAAAEQVEHGREGEVDLRLLHVPALYLMSLWLRPAGATDDAGVFIPIAPAPPGLEPNRPYEVDEFRKRVRELAQQVPATSHEEPSGGG